MTRDRLAELRQKARVSESEEDEEQNTTLNSVQPYSNGQGAIVIPMERLDGLDRFFQQVEDLRRLVGELKADVENVKIYHREILSTPVPDDKKKHELDGLMSTVKTSSLVIRAKLKDMEKGVHQEEEEIEQDSTPASLRIRRTQHSSILREFREVIIDYSNAQTDYRDRCKGRIKRQIEITGSDFTDEQVDNMIEEGNFAVFTHGILVEAEQARQMLADVQARHNDILKLEKSLKELHDLFLEMATLVESQGEIVDRIENQVTSTRDYTEKATVQLVQAQVLQTAARKKKICIIITIIIIVIILGLVIYFSLP